MKVYISTKSYRSPCYHTNPECVRLPDSFRELEKSQLNKAYEKCDYCDDNLNNKGPESFHCSFCGETVGKLPDHLPCDGGE